MNAYTLALACGVTGLIAQAYAAGLATELFLRRESSRETRLLWISLAIGALHCWPCNTATRWNWPMHRSLRSAPEHAWCARSAALRVGRLSA